MKAKKTEKIEAGAAQPVAAKPLTKAVATAKPLSKAAPAAKSAVKAPAVQAKPVAVSAKPVVAVKPAVKKVKSAPVVKQAVEVAKAEKDMKGVKKPKLKVVRDSFTMPQSEYQKIAEIKELCLKSGVQVKKSEVLRAGVIALCAMNEEQLKAAMSTLDKIKTGRPNKQ
jgi:hypothetical protein